MPDELEAGKLVLALCCAGGAALGFVVARRDWNQGQRWRKSEELEKFIDKFEANGMCKLACTLLDWSARTTAYDGKKLILTTANALEALALHDVDHIAKYTGNAALLRDALDGLLAFLVRLHGACARNFIEADQAKLHFAYWLARLIAFDLHADEDGTQAMRVARYIIHYSNPTAIAGLCELFEINAPELQALMKRTEAGSKLEKLARAKLASKPSVDDHCDIPQ
jgi:hypothetical protein